MEVTFAVKVHGDSLCTLSYWPGRTIRKGGSSRVEPPRQSKFAETDWTQRHHWTLHGTKDLGTWVHSIVLRSKWVQSVTISSDKSRGPRTRPFQQRLEPFVTWNRLTQSLVTTSWDFVPPTTVGPPLFTHYNSTLSLRWLTLFSNGLTPFFAIITLFLHHTR